VTADGHWLGAVRQYSERHKFRQSAPFDLFLSPSARCFSSPASRGMPKVTVNDQYEVWMQGGKRTRLHERAIAKRYSEEGGGRCLRGAPGFCSGSRRQ
jgi:hypothetical protein